MPPTAANTTAKESATSAPSKSKKESKVTPLGNHASIEEFAKSGLVEIVEATKSANAFPQGAARDLYCAYPTFGRIIDQQSHHILGVISKVLKWQNVKGNIQRRQQDEQFEMLLECNDAILERLNSNLDELAGIKKNPQTIVIESRMQTINAGATSSNETSKGAGSWNLKKHETTPMAARLITAKNIARPQIKFQIPVDNSALTPFMPKLKDKPNSLKPLAVLPEYDETGNIVSYLHPYEFELMKFEVADADLKYKKVTLPTDTADTPLEYVDTVPKLRAALEELRAHKEIAIDVEHHSYRTFLGFTCLIQISTRVKDYLFDALELRDDLHILNDVLTDPKVVKILHGADSDIEWLQRDLSLYIVNMFDTHQAAKALNFARLSLSYLLKHYCDIEADKTFQLADWRMRPLAAELVAYARQDTHYLIYIFERITNDLLDAANGKANLLRTIYQRSTELCKKRYIKPIVTSESYMDVFRKSKRIFDNRQLFALREIFQWRDTVARQEDESYGYVLPNHMMLQIAESLPREMQGILACCNPIPPLVRQHLHTLHQIVLRARDQPLVKPILETDAVHRAAINNVKDYNSKLYCPHDLSHCEEFRDDLPTLLNFKNPDALALPQQQLNVQLCKPVLSVFDTPVQSEEEDELRRQTIIHNKIQTITPYQRYLAMLPLAEKEKLEEAARLEAENKKRKLCPAEPMLPVKKEPEEQTVTADDDDLYSLPIKEMLKRKYEESVAKKAASATNNCSPKAKRIKTETSSSSSSANKKQTQSQNTSSVTNADSSSVVVVSDSDSDAPPIEMPSTSQAHAQQQQQQQTQINANKARFKNKNKRNRNQNQKHAQSSDRPVPSNFDYKNVDFKKFKGGAQRAKGTELKPQFHGKNNKNKAQNKKFNKLFTFSNVKSNK